MTGPVFRTLIPSLPLFSSKFQQPPAHHPLATIRNPSLTLVAEPFSSPWVPSLPVEKSARPSSRRSSSPGRRTKGCIELLASLSRRIAGFVGRCLSELTVSLSELTFLFKLSLSLCLSSLSFSVAVISDSVVTVTSFLPRCRFFLELGIFRLRLLSCASAAVCHAEELPSSSARVAPSLQPVSSFTIGVVIVWSLSARRRLVAVIWSPSSVTLNRSPSYSVQKSY
ncbi:uncharacterized protein DS421_14g460730 [Arachis hypogaea]|nr:uncharacterized protein DS421_14g460730 [Arachis hypogaea]